LPHLEMRLSGHCGVSKASRFDKRGEVFAIWIVDIRREVIGPWRDAEARTGTCPCNRPRQWYIERLVVFGKFRQDKSRSVQL
jgi:hypothetical protein